MKIITCIKTQYIDILCGIFFGCTEDSIYKNWYIHILKMFAFAKCKFRREPISEFWVHLFRITTEIFYKDFGCRNVSIQKSTTITKQSNVQVLQTFKDPVWQHESPLQTHANSFMNCAKAFLTVINRPNECVCKTKLDKKFGSWGLNLKFLNPSHILIFLLVA